MLAEAGNPTGAKARSRTVDTCTKVLVWESCFCRQISYLNSDGWKGNGLGPHSEKPTSPDLSNLPCRSGSKLISEWATSCEVRKTWAKHSGFLPDRVARCRMRLTCLFRRL